MWKKQTPLQHTAFGNFYNGKLIHLLAAYGDDSGGADYKCYFDKNEKLVHCQITLYNHERTEDKVKVHSTEEKDGKVIAWINDRNMSIGKSEAELKMEYEELLKELAPYIIRVKQKH